MLQKAACHVVSSTHGRQRITNGPVFCLATAKAHLASDGLIVVNETARDDQARGFDPQLDDGDIIAFINALVEDDWIESERCKTSVRMTLDCDAYAMRWNRHKRCRWEYAAKIYIKFGFADNIHRVLIVSIHPATY